MQWESSKERKRKAMLKMEHREEAKKLKSIKTSTKKERRGKRIHRKIVRMLREMKSEGVV